MKTPLFLIAAMLLGAASSRAVVPPQLTAAERSACDAFNDPVEGPACLATRGYWKVCRNVIAKPATALTLPNIVDLYDDKYLNKSEQADVDNATNLRFAAMVTKPINS